MTDLIITAYSVGIIVCAVALSSYDDLQGVIPGVSNIAIALIWPILICGWFVSSLGESLAAMRDRS